VAFAAAHVVADPLGTGSPHTEPGIDWDATLAYRHHLWDLGLGVAEAMDTAQRGMGLPPQAVAELIRRSLEAAAQRGASVACGAATDGLAADEGDLESIASEYRRQAELIEGAGGQVVIMASRQLARGEHPAWVYEKIYATVLGELSRPAVLHWLGTAFDPALDGYWGSSDLDQATDALLRIVEANVDKVDGIKLSLLDDQREVALRRRLPPGVRMYTGDDFNFPELISSGSDALLGVFDAIAPLAAQALTHLDRGEEEAFKTLLAPTVPLSRTLFEQPTYHYKVGVVFLAYLRGFQDHFRMLGGLESARSALHLAQVFRLADQAGLFQDSELAARRMRAVLVGFGIDDNGNR
jgi:hypothetical protein